MDTHRPFPHERLVPRGFGDESRQINNAAASVVRNICEGAGRWKPADKIYRFEIANGEASEAAGAVVSLLDANLGDDVLAERFLHLERSGLRPAVIGPSATYPAIEQSREGPVDVVVGELSRQSS